MNSEQCARFDLPAKLFRTKQQKKKKCTQRQQTDRQQRATPRHTKLFDDFVLKHYYIHGSLFARPFLRRAR